MPYLFEEALVNAFDIGEGGELLEDCAEVRLMCSADAKALALCAADSTS